MALPGSEARAPSEGQLGAAVPADRRALVSQWSNGLRINHIAQSRAAAECASRGKLLGTATVVLSAVVGTAIFASLEGEPSTVLRIVTGLLSTAAAVAAALHTFLGYQERSAAHRQAAGRYGRLRRELESSELDEGAGSWDRVREVVRQWNELDEAAPLVSRRVHDGAVEAVFGDRSVSRGDGR